METELIPNDREVAFLEGLCPSSLPWFLVPCPITAACSTPRMLDVLLQNVCFQTCISMWPYGLSPTCSENWAWKRPWPPSHLPSRTAWEELLGGCRNLCIAHPAPQPAGTATSIAVPRLEAIGLAYVMYSWLPLVQCSSWKWTREPKSTIGISRCVSGHPTS